MTLPLQTSSAQVTQRARTRAATPEPETVHSTVYASGEGTLAMIKRALVAMSAFAVSVRGSTTFPEKPKIATGKSIFAPFSLGAGLRTRPDLVRIGTLNGQLEDQNGRLSVERAHRG
jgi:hypothetical protein